MLEAILYVKSSKLLEHCSIPTITIALKSRCVYRIIGHRDNVLFSAAVWCAWHDLQRFRVFRFHPYANQVFEPISRIGVKLGIYRLPNLCPVSCQPMSHEGSLQLKDEHCGSQTLQSLSLQYGTCQELQVSSLAATALILQKLVQRSSGAILVCQ
jgi:hypothetical protein